MLEEKRTDLEAEKRRKLLQRLVENLSHASPAVYYMPTSEIAKLLVKTIETGGRLSPEDRAMLKPLSARDIEVILSLH